MGFMESITNKPDWDKTIFDIELPTRPPEPSSTEAIDLSVKWSTMWVLLSFKTLLSTEAYHAILYGVVSS